MLKRSFENDELFEQFRKMWDLAVTILANKSKLYEMTNQFDLDNALEKIHEAKISIDFSIHILEQLISLKTYELKELKEELKVKKMKFEIAFDSSNRAFREDNNAETYKRRRDNKVTDKMSDINKKLRELEYQFDIIKFELKHSERTRENITDVYQSIKKKYDALIRFANG